MREARYPLAAARTQRDHARQVAELSLRAARDRLAEAQAALETARQRAELHARSRNAALEAHARQGSEQHAGFELTRAGLYAARLRAELSVLSQQLRAAQRSLSVQARAVRLAELAVTQAHAEREVLERHHERFRESERLAHLKAQELEAEELPQRTRVKHGNA
jgi:hypothetical protein